MGLRKSTPVASNKPKASERNAENRERVRLRYRERGVGYIRHQIEGSEIPSMALKGP